MVLKRESGWKHFVFLVLIIISILVLVIYFRSGRNNVKFSQDVTCNALEVNGDPKESIDIVFLADNYADTNKFSQDVIKYKDALLNVVPLNEFKNKFNFYYISGNFDLGCKYDEAIICDPRNVKKVSLACPNDYYVVLTEYNGIKNLFRYLRSSSWQKVMSLNTADSTLVFAHEIGHAIFNFADEYEFDGEINWGAPNCVKPNCDAFNVIPNPGCYSGCTNMEYFRECDTCIMRDYWNGLTYGSFNEWYMRNFLNSDSLTTGKVVSNVIEKEDLYIINAKFVDTGIEITNVETVNGYAPGNYDKQGWSFKIGEDVLYVGYPISFEDTYIDGQVYGGIKDMNNQEFSVMIPIKDNEGEQINILDPNGELTGTFALPEENKVLFIHEISKQTVVPFSYPSE